MNQPRIYLSPPHMGGDELKLVQETFASNWIAPLGPQVDAFEKEFAAHVDSPHAAALSSGTAALHLALKLLGVKPGDDVICSALTFSASANPIIYEGATPVFIDCEKTSWNLDPELLSQALREAAVRKKLPKALILVHLYGQSADIDAVAGLCEQYGVPLIEDAAEALGALYYGARTADGGQLTADGGGRTTEGGGQMSDVSRRSSGIAPGTRGLFGVYSFNGNKIITTSGGGMLVSPDKALIEKAKFLATQARDPAPHYQHSQIGYNYRLSNVLAAVGRGQLRVLDQRVEKRRQNFAYYQEKLGGLPGLVFMPEATWGRCTRWLTCITIDPTVAGTDREKVRLALAEANIEARPIWKPMHLQPVFAGCPYYGAGVSDDIFNRGLCLPSGSNLSEEDLARVVGVVRSAFRR